MRAPTLAARPTGATQADRRAPERTAGERIELLGVDLLDANRSTVEAFRRLARKLGVQIGWHYLLDLSWTAAVLRESSAVDVLDAGAGLGLMQWWLAEQGARVISADRQNRRELPFRFRARYRVSGLRQEDLLSPASSLATRLTDGSVSAGPRAASAVRALAGWFLAWAAPKARGKIVLYHQDLSSLVDVADGSLDAVVAISSLEHNTPEALPRVVLELQRILRPGGRIIATLAAAETQDWFHQPSRGWCYTEASLRRLFGLGPTVPSNYAGYKGLMGRLRESAELRQGLAPFHFASGESGMPWGKWDPAYQPVGVVKIKEGGPA